MVDRDVFYSCGSCGHPLNLSSSHRTVSSIDGKYSKAIRKGTISFLYIDESRFMQLEEVKCVPHFQANGLFGFHQMRTRLLCGKCGKAIGYGRSDGRLLSPIDDSDTSSGSGTPERKTYSVKIKALQPSFDINPIGPITY